MIIYFRMHKRGIFGIFLISIQLHKRSKSLILISIHRYMFTVCFTYILQSTCVYHGTLCIRSIGESVVPWAPYLMLQALLLCFSNLFWFQQAYKWPPFTPIHQQLHLLHFHCLPNGVQISNGSFFDGLITLPVICNTHCHQLCFVNIIIFTTHGQNM